MIFGVIDVQVMVHGTLYKVSQCYYTIYGVCGCDAGSSGACVRGAGGLRVGAVGAGPGCPTRPPGSDGSHLPSPRQEQRPGARLRPQPQYTGNLT